MKYREIDIQEWERSGAGATAISYNHKQIANMMLKVFKSNILRSDYAKSEYDLSHKVAALGISTPKALEIVKVDNCLGILYERIVNKASVSRLCANNPDDIEKYAGIFAAECKRLHSIGCNPDDFPSRKKQALDAVARHKGYTRHTKKALTFAINRLEDKNVCLHGDMQPGNVIIAGEKPYWIDLGFFAWGDPMFDIACLYFFCKHPVGQLWGCKLCHLSRRQLKHFWEAFACKYSDNPTELTHTARKNVPVYLAYTIGLENYTGITATVFDIYMNTICLSSLQ